jgi:hypothetical protein
MIAHMAQLRISFCFVGAFLCAPISPLVSFCLGEQGQYREAKTIPLKRAFQTNRDWNVSAYIPREPEHELGDVPVKICFWHDPEEREDTKTEKHCTPIISASGNPHQNLEDFSVVTLIQSSPPFLGVRSVARYAWGGSGSLADVSIWSHNKTIDSFEKLISLGVGEIDDYKIMSSGPLAGSIITASGLWQSEEGHFGDHRFYIQVYRYGNYYKTFHKVFGFTTMKKYPSDPNITVIEQELGTVTKLLKHIYGAKSPVD